MTNNMKIKTGDTIRVWRGKDRGKTGKVEAVFPKTRQVVVGGVNVYKKHVKSREGQKGGIIEVTKPIRAAHVRVVCSACNRPTRVGYQGSKGNKERICKKCGVSLEKKQEKKKK
jgi:large subunit ribosomal protein L24